MQRRRANRYPFRAKARVHGGAAPDSAKDAITRDHSGRGLYLHMDEPLREGTQVRLTLEVPSEISPSPVTVDCLLRVTRVQEEADGRIGVGGVIEQYSSFGAPRAAADAAGRRRYLPELLAMAEMTFGPRHPDVARSMYYLARMYLAQGRAEEALSLSMRALAMDENAPGVNLGDVAQTLENYAELMRKLQRAADARQMESRAKTLRTTPH